VVDPGKAALFRMYNLFKSLVPYWIDETAERCKTHITNAVEGDDTVQVITSDVKFSASAADTADILAGMFKLRDELDWPVTAEMMEFTLIIVQKVTELAMFFVNQSYDQYQVNIEQKQEDSEFQATKQVINIKLIHACTYIHVCIYICINIYVLYNIHTCILWFWVN